MSTSGPPDSVPARALLAAKPRGNLRVVGDGHDPLRAAPQAFAMKSHPHLSEKWIQERIAEDPSLLGLGEVEVKDLERMQPRAGRLDMLLVDLVTATCWARSRLQLGATDESHLIRTIEYRDIERGAGTPNTSMLLWIVAEEITARFFNVINLFNGFIPLVAIQVSAVEVEDDAVTLVFTKVLDRMPTAPDDDEPEEPRGPCAFEKKGSPETLEMTDQLLELVHQVDPGVTLKYNKNYIGLARGGLGCSTLLPPSAPATRRRLQDKGLRSGWDQRARPRRRRLINRGHLARRVAVLRGLRSSTRGCHARESGGGASRLRDNVRRSWLRGDDRERYCEYLQHRAASSLLGRSAGAKPWHPCGPPGACRS